MDQGSNFKRNNLPTVQQICYLRELKRLGSKRGCVGIVAGICGVNHGSVSRFFRTCCDNGWLTENLQFTEAGEAWLSGYLKLQEGLKNYLQQIGIASRDMEETIRSLIEHVSYDTLAAMLRGTRTSHDTRTVGKKEPAPKNIVKNIIEYGTHQVYFVLFRQDLRNGYAVSMADRGFRKPGILRHSRRGSYLELEICEMAAVSRVNGQSMKGYLETLKYEKGGAIQKAVMRDGKIRIPLEVCHLRKRQGGELKGELSVMVTCSVGRIHMPESTALLMFWL